MDVCPAPPKHFHTHGLRSSEQDPHNPNKINPDAYARGPQHTMSIPRKRGVSLDDLLNPERPAQRSSIASLIDPTPPAGPGPEKSEENHNSRISGDAKITSGSDDYSGEKTSTEADFAPQKRVKTEFAGHATPLGQTPRFSSISNVSCGSINESEQSLLSGDEHRHNEHNQSGNIPNLVPIEKISAWGVIVYACPLCPRECVSPSALITHLRTHTGEKPYQCDICHKKLSSERILAMHMRTHTGEKPYECGICGKKLTSKASLSIHLGTHTGENYQCHICNKKLSTKQVLARHMKIHTGETASSAVGKKPPTERPSGEVKAPGNANPKRLPVGVFSPVHSEVKKQSPIQEKDMMPELAAGVVSGVVSGVNSAENPDLKHRSPLADKGLVPKYALAPQHSPRTGEFQTENYQYSVYPPPPPLGVPQGYNPGAYYPESYHLGAYHPERYTYPQSYHKGTSLAETPFPTPSYLLPPEAGLSGHTKALSVNHAGGETASNEKYPCKFCPAELPSEQSLTGHVKVHTENYPFPCFVCHDKQYTKANLAEHMESHKGGSQIQSRGGSQGESHEQSQGDLHSHAHVHSHLCSHPPPNFHPYEHLHTPYPPHQHIHQHIHQHSNQHIHTENTSPLEPPKSPSQWDQKSPKELTPHSMTHPMKKPMTHPVTPPPALVVHTSLGEKPFECSICQKKLSSKPNLKIHMRTHTGEKPFQCQICQKRLSSKNSLNLHLGTHKGEKPYDCIICQRSLSSKQRLISHLATHIDHKIQCGVCKQKLPSKQALIDHLVAHSEERYQCTICSKKFSTQHVLTRHMESHVDEKHYCTICHSRLSSRRALARHMRTHTDETTKPYLVDAFAAGP